MSNEQDLELLSADETEGFNFSPPVEDVEEIAEPETPPGKEVETPPSTDNEGEPPVETPVKEVAKEPSEPKLSPEPKPDERPPAIEGVLTKDGKNVIPFSVLSDERAENQALKAELVELRKKVEAPPTVPKPDDVKPPEPSFRKQEPSPIDFKALGAKLYSSEEGAGEVLEQIWKAGIEAGKSAAEETAKTVGKTAAESAVNEADFKKETNRLLTANPWIRADKTGLIEDALFNRASALMEERKVNDLAGMVKAAEDAVAEGKVTFKIDQPQIDINAEREKARKEGYDAGVRALMAKLNIKEEPVTLADMRNVNPDITSKFDEIEKLSGLDYEEAIGLLTPSEKEAFLRKTT